MFDRQSLRSLLTLIAGVAATIVVIAMQPEPHRAIDSAAPVLPVCDSPAAAGAPGPCAVAATPCTDAPLSVARSKS